jgi:hypothetical protein
VTVTGRKKMKMIKIIIAALMLMIMPLALQAQVAQVVAIRGTVLTTQELKQGDLVEVGQTVVTAQRAFVVLQFKDGARVTVRPNSTMIIEEYSYLEGDDAVELNLVQGGMRVLTGAIAKSDPEAYKVRTPVALMGVRGTEFSVQLLD